MSAEERARATLAAAVQIALADDVPSAAIANVSAAMAVLGELARREGMTAEQATESLQTTRAALEEMFWLGFAGQAFEAGS